MTFIRKKLFIFTALMLSFSGVSLAETCLTYKSMGDSDCQGGLSNKEEITIINSIAPFVPPSLKPKAPVKEVVPTIVIKPTPELTNEPPTLDDRIDEYMDSYNKPPREFVAFNLDPTLDNALKWAKKYREMMERNRKLTAAWGQAQTILKEMEANGAELEGYEPMAEIPDYGAALPNHLRSFNTDLPSQQIDYNSIAINSATRHGAPTLGFAEGEDLSSSFLGRGDSNINNTSGSLFGSSLTNSQKSEDGPIEISYYFSAVCPYCKRFETGFKTLIEELGSELKVTCVDMTPSERKKENIYGKIDCSWRAAIPGEAKALGVTSTPTLLINRKSGQGIEKVEGVVDIGKLKEFLLGKG